MFITPIELLTLKPTFNSLSALFFNPPSWRIFFVAKIFSFYSRYKFKAKNQFYFKKAHNQEIA
ncbi:hypothetical protein A9G41_10215 [Gilliamella sp. Nev5-1]|nr:hypothetical protein A9G40_08515 [Gilliamella apicola]OCG67442.1 hypothetical protein A9G41_10215 [Gilliamella apicola]